MEKNASQPIALILISLVLVNGMALAAGEDASPEPSVEGEQAPLGNIGGCRYIHERNLEGFRIDNVTPGSTAAEAGLESGDVLIAMDGEPLAIDSMLKAVRFFHDLEAGKEIELTVLRNGEEVHLTVVPTSVSADYERSMRSSLAAMEEEAIHQDVMHWLKSSTRSGAFVIEIEALSGGDLAVRPEDETFALPEGLESWLLSSHFAPELRKIPVGESWKVEVSRKPNGDLAFDQLTD